MAEADARAALERLIEERGEDYSALSRLIGRNAAYVQQYIKRGTPKRLAEEDRRILARYFGVSEQVLGGSAHAPSADQVAVPRLDVVASAGPGALPGEERPQSHVGFDRKWLRGLGAGDGRQLSMIRVVGDSMAPALVDGDEILVDRNDGVSRLRDGIYVLRRDDFLMVKRLSPDPSGRRVAIVSDNANYPSWPGYDLSSIDIVGRVVWCGRKL
ncbi:MAG TPA: S24 family peptidase [Allosphingosinicella sp.]|nr:S24 family peptidase [Allosphingosinicella sp.]